MWCGRTMRGQLFILALLISLSSAQVRIVNFLGFQDFFDPDFNFDYHESTPEHHGSYTEAPKVETSHNSGESPRTSETSPVNPTGNRNVSSTTQFSTSHPQSPTSKSSTTSETSTHEKSTTPSDVPTTTAPDVPTTTAPDVPTTTAPDVPTTTAPDVPTTTAPDVPTTTASDVPTTTLPETPTEPPLPTWIINTTLPEPTTISTPKPPLPFVAAFNTSCIAGAVLYVGADTTERNDMIFYPPPDSKINGTCTDEMDVINLNTTWYPPEYNDAEKIIYLTLYFIKTTANAYRLAKLVFLIPDENNVYERYYCDDIPYVVDVPVGQSYMCNGTTYMQLKHINESRRPLNFTFRDIWVEAFRLDRYQPLGPPKYCADGAGGAMVILIVVMAFLGLALIVIGIIVYKFCGLYRRRQALIDSGDYDLLDESGCARTRSEQFEQAFIEDERSQSVQYSERDDVDNKGKKVSKIFKKSDKRESTSKSKGRPSREEEGSCDVEDAIVPVKDTALLLSHTTDQMVDSLGKVEDVLDGIHKSIEEANTRRDRAIAEEVEKELKEVASRESTRNVYEPKSLKEQVKEVVDDQQLKKLEGALDEPKTLPEA